TLRFGSEDKPGPTLKRLYDAIQAIQYGEAADRHKWMMPVGRGAGAGSRFVRFHRRRRSAHELSPGQFRREVRAAPRAMDAQGRRRDERLPVQARAARG